MVSDAEEIVYLDLFIYLFQVEAEAEEMRPLIIYHSPVENSFTLCPKQIKTIITKRETKTLPKASQSSRHLARAACICLCSRVATNW